ncbi:MAG TPA: histidine kinase N-terminal 7TM domain-containing protein [Caldilinea sp.]|nr:histidine kinase N-terminal 7TM domain-containing protein [Caldilinea sp.]
MIIEITLYGIVCLGAAGIAVVAAFLAWRRRDVPGGASLAALMSMLAIWSFGSAFENNAADVDAKLFWAKVCYIGIVTSPVLFFTFALEYCRLDRWLTRRTIALLFVVPLLSFGLVATNEWHGLIWSSIAPSTTGRNLLVTGRGPLFWVVVLGYSYSLMLLAAAILVYTALRLPAQYRRQTWLILASVAIPWVVNIVYVASTGPSTSLDLTPIALVASGVLIALNIFHFRLLDLAPIARATLVEHMADGMILLDMQDCIVDLNPAAGRYFGAEDRSVIGKHVSAVLADWPTIFEQLAEDDKVHIEMRVADGTLRFMQVNSAPLIDKRGRRSGRVIVTHDDTLHHQAENALRRQNDYLNALQQTEMELVAQFDLPSLLENIVRRAGLLVGTESGYLDLVDPETRLLKPQIGIGVLAESLKHQVQPGEGVAGHVWQSGQPLVINDYDAWAGRIRNFSHTTLHAVVGVPLRRGTEVVGVLGLGHPVGSGRTFSEEEVDLLSRFASLAAIAIENARLYARVQRDNHYLESLLRNIPTAISIIDREGRVLSWNPAAETLFGYTAEEAIGKEADLLIAASARLQDEAHDFTRRTFDGQSVHVVTQRTAKDGALIDVELRAIPIVVSDKPLGALAIYHDITGLQRARRAAESAARAKSEFLANMSHELRTPLNAILGFSGLLARGRNLSAQQQENLAIITRSGEHLLDLINDVLDMAKLESGRLTLHNTLFDLHRLLDELVEMFRQRAAVKGIALTLACGQDVPHVVFADNRKLRQVLINLLGNAVKFTDSGAVVLTAGCVQAADGCRLRLMVQDTGPGITAADVGLIFEPFVQVGARPASREGTGLGLPISREIARLMGGDLTVSSSGIPGEGALFCLDLPLSETDGVASSDAQADVPDPQPAASARQGDGAPTHAGIAWHELPPAQLDALRAAAVAADAQRLQALAGNLAASRPEIAATLVTWIEHFDYAAIIAAVAGAERDIALSGTTPS